MSLDDFVEIEAFETASLYVLSLKYTPNEPQWYSS